MRRLLLDPTPADGGGGGGATPAEEKPGVSPEVLADLRAIKADLLALRRAREEEARQAAAVELAKGKPEDLVRSYESELAARDAALRDVSARAHQAELRHAITTALAGHNLVEGAADQLLRLWADDFEVEDAADGLKVRCKSDHRAPGEVVAERLGGKLYAHFVRAAGRGGGGAGGGVPAPTQGYQEASRASLGHVRERLRGKYFPEG